MSIFSRSLDLKLPPGQSAFLWGPRKTGKTTYVRKRFPDSVVFDFLDTDLFLEFAKRPALLRERLLARKPSELKRPVILDEVQIVPALLDEVHGLIESRKIQFVLCGSSARKLKKGHANLLGGRAWRYEMFPLVFPEIPGFDLLKALNQGLIPSHYQQPAPDAARSLKAYVQDYLKEEIFAEGLVRNLPAFARFFDAVGFCDGQLVNHSDVARDCGIDAKTVREYFQILSDTLIGRLVEPFKRRRSRDLIRKAPKFYLFDSGVSSMISGRNVKEMRGEHFGRAFEQLIFNQIIAYSSYSGKDFPIRFWRTRNGMEVDFILGDAEVAIEIKGTNRLGPKDFHGLAAFLQEHSPREAIIVCQEREERVCGRIRVLPWKIFFERLWKGGIL